MNIKSTPILAQYQDIKLNYPDCIVCFRLGDFYEIFYEEAEIVSAELGIALTSRANHDERVPMCGFPAHSSETYISRLVKNGHKVAICEQVQLPSERSGNQPLKREVTRVITAGTLTEDSLLSGSCHNFLLSCSLDDKNAGYVICDISTGDMLANTVSLRTLVNAFEQWNPSEFLLPDSVVEHEIWNQLKPWHSKIHLVPDIKFNHLRGKTELEKFYKVGTLDSFGSFSNKELEASSVLLDYIQFTQKTTQSILKPLIRIHDQNIMEMDAFTRINLEIDKTLQGTQKGSLMHLLSQTVTAAGTRQLSLRLSTPSTSLSVLTERYDSVAFFVNNRDLHIEINTLLKSVSDIERSISRLSLNRAGPKDLLMIENSLKSAIALHSILVQYQLPKELNLAISHLTNLNFLQGQLQAAIIDDAPIKCNQGAFIKSGYSRKIDDLRMMKNSQEQVIERLQENYKQESNISMLKIKFRAGAGFYIEIPKSQIGKVPYSFHKEQELSNVIRFSTVQLREYSAQILDIGEKILTAEIEIFEFLSKLVLDNIEHLILVAKSIAVIDVSLSMAKLAIKHDYVQPELLQNDNKFTIEKGRHPIVEDMMFGTANNFVFNDCILNDKKCTLITGANMSGKSTYLKQNALIILMAQIGSFVPAKYAQIGIVDKLFVRVGASDNLTKGVSTFMVEMIEVATILHKASNHSFVVVDEVGRGTSVQEGYAIAKSVLEYLSNSKIRSLFATHYHELTQNNDENIQCATMLVKFWQNDLMFLHKLVSGCAEASHAIEIGKLAGVPIEILHRAQEILNEKENLKKLNDQSSAIKEYPKAESIHMTA